MEEIKNFPNEIWKDIIGYEGLYKISSEGRVKSLASKGKGRKQYDKLMNPIVRNGYLRISLTKDKKESKKTLHKLLAIHFIPNPDQKPEVNHKNGIRHDNRLSNLEWVTTRENCSHRNIQKGSKYIGVSFSKIRQKFRARVYIKGVDKHLGFFETAEEARDMVIECLNKNSIRNKYINYG